jgi:hypothetical protein
MDYSLFSSSGNLIDSFDNEDDARAALQRIVGSEPEVADDVALLISDDAGNLVGGPIHALPVPTR